MTKGHSTRTAKVWCVICCEDSVLIGINVFVVKDGHGRFVCSTNMYFMWLMEELKMPLNVLSEIYNCNIFTQGLINFLVYFLVIRYQSKRSSFLLIHYEMNFTCFCENYFCFCVYVACVEYAELRSKTTTLTTKFQLKDANFHIIWPVIRVLHWPDKKLK